MKLGAIRPTLFAGMLLGLLGTLPQGRQAAGGTTARWVQVAPTTIELEGMLFDSSGLARCRADATPEGRGVGAPAGTIRTVTAGLLASSFEASFLLAGAPGAPHGVDAGAARPWRPFPRGHFHGRWRMP